MLRHVSQALWCSNVPMDLHEASASQPIGFLFDLVLYIRIFVVERFWLNDKGHNVEPAEIVLASFRSLSECRHICNPPMPQGRRETRTTLGNNRRQTHAYHLAEYAVSVFIEPVDDKVFYPFANVVFLQR